MEHQEWRDGANARSNGTSKSKDASKIGGEGVLGAFEQGGDPSWICNQFLAGASWKGVLTTES